MVNGPDDVRVERGRRIERAPEGLFEGEEPILHLIERIVGPLGLRWPPNKLSDFRFRCVRLGRYRKWVHLPDSIETVRPSVIQVLVVPAPPASPDEGVVGAPAFREAAVAGTEFLVHPGGFALTARHVVVGAKQLIDAQGGELRAGLAIPELTGNITIRASFELIALQVVEEDPRHDLALVRLDPNPFTSGKASGVTKTSDGGIGINAQYGLAPLWGGSVRDGVSIAVSGYPSVAPALITTHGVLASATAIDMVEMQPPGAPEGFTMPDTKDSYLIDVAVNPGNSGGPVYLVYEAAVIGVCVAFRTAAVTPEGGSPFMYNSGISVAVPIKYGIDLLGRHATL